MSEANKALIRRWFEEVWNKGREEVIDELFAADGIAHGLADESGKTLRGGQDYKPFFQKFRSAFPNIQVVVEDTVAEGDKVAARCTVRGETSIRQLRFRGDWHGNGIYRHHNRQD